MTTLDQKEQQYLTVMQSVRFIWDELLDATSPEGDAIEAVCLQIRERYMTGDDDYLSSAMFDADMAVLNGFRSQIEARFKPELPHYFR